MRFNCLNCGLSVGLATYYTECSVDRFCLDAFQKTERIKYQGKCARCGADFNITMEQQSVIEDQKKEGE